MFYKMPRYSWNLTLTFVRSFNDEQLLAWYKNERLDSLTANG